MAFKEFSLEKPVKNAVPDMGVPVRGHVTSAYLGGPPNGYYDY